MPSSIVIELQRESLSKEVAITDLLRKAYVVAKKLKLKEFESWIDNELNGYSHESSDKYPAYRLIRGTPEMFNPYHGWKPILFENPKTETAYSERHCAQPISELDHMLFNSSKDGRFEIPYPGRVSKNLMDAVGMDLTPTLHVSQSSLSRIVDSVRNTVLKWALQLEEDGIIGDGLTFTSEEVKKAQTMHYTINYFAGNVSNSQVQQGTSGSNQGHEK